MNNTGILFTKASCPCACHKGILGVEAKLHAFITSALDRDEWSASYPKHFTACGKSHYPLHGSLGVPHSQLGCWSKISCTFQKLNSLPSCSPFSSPYINYILKLTWARSITITTIIIIITTATTASCFTWMWNVKYDLALRESNDSAGAKGAKENTITNNRTQLSETLWSGSSFACHLHVHNPNLKSKHICSVYVDLMELLIPQTMHHWMVKWPV